MINVLCFKFNEQKILEKNTISENSVIYRQHIIMNFKTVRLSKIYTIGLTIILIIDLRTFLLF